MPVTPTYPGVYIEEVPSGVRTITGVATSITAFIGRTVRGPVNEPRLLTNFGEFERIFGGIDKNYTVGYAVKDFFVNGGAQAIVVRLYRPFFSSDAERMAALNAASTEAQTAADAVSQAAATAAGEVGATAESTAEAANNSVASAGAGGAIALLAAQRVAAAATAAAEEESATANDVAAASTSVAATIITEASVAAAIGNTAPLNRARISLSNGLTLEAATPGIWGNGLSIDVDHSTKPVEPGDPDDELFNISITDRVSGKVEQIRNVTGAPDAVRNISRVLINESSLLRVLGTPPEGRPDEGEFVVAADGRAVDSQVLQATDYTDSMANKTGLYALEKADLFNILCIPPDSREGDTAATVYQAALSYCVSRRAMLLVDPPASWSANPDTAADAAVAGLPDLGLTGTAARNAALFFPRMLQADPSRANQIDTFVPCGAVAGVFARTDAVRGVWKAPAGLDAAINGIAGLQVVLSDGDNGKLNPLGINSLRNFALAGQVLWGARTLRGADSIGDEYKYIPVRRTALFLEETLYRNTQWVVFEPNDEALWSQIRLNIGAFMHDLFRKGAFQGIKPKDAYFVKCDSETTTQNDINLGIVNIVVGFAPLKPAEFVIIKLQQLAGQLES